MDSPLSSPNVLLGIYCALVLLASLAGGWLLLAMRLTHARLQTAVSLVSGLMLGMALLHFIPHALHQNHSVDQTMRLALGGFLVMFFLQRFFPHHHHDVSEGAPEHGHRGGERPHRHEVSTQHGLAPQTLAEQSASQLSWAATTVGMAFHSLLGGVALAAAVGTEAGGHSGLVGLGTALVIILHKPFDAMTVSTLMAASGCSRFARHVLNVLFALVTPLGAVLFYAGASHFFASNPAVLGGALAFCAGTFLCIACADLLPELQFHSHDRLKLSLALAAGLAVAVLIGVFETSGHDYHHGVAPAEAAGLRPSGPTRTGWESLPGAK
jgi:zinc and cadmium transporter